MSPRLAGEFGPRDSFRVCVVRQPRSPAVGRPEYGFIWERVVRLDTYVGLLARVPLFAGLAREQLATLIRMGGLKEFAAGEAMTRRGDIGAASYVIVVGRAEMERPDEEGGTVELGPGAFIGDLAMFVECAYDVTVRARNDVLTLEFTRPVMRAILEYDPSMAEHFADCVRQRLRALARALDDLARELETADESPNGADGGSGAGRAAAANDDQSWLATLPSPSPPASAPASMAN